MESWQTRLESFKKSKRVKSGKGWSTLKWPHPSTYVANPESLAEAGFYFNPSPHNPDGVTCFACHKGISDWEEDDDPFVEHTTRGQHCYWAIARCALRDDQTEDGSYIFPDPARLPTSKTMEKARLDSFGPDWPHDAVRGHGANSRKMAKAGFMYTPQGPEDDTATCFYCGISLSGWDHDDDPLEEHRKRDVKQGNTCAFFASQSAALGKSTVRPPASRASSKAASRAATSKKKIIPEPEPEPEEISSDEEEEDQPPTTTRSRASKQGSTSRVSSVPAKTPASRKSTRSTATSARSRTTIDSEDDAEASGSDAGKRVSKSKRKGVAKGKERIEAIVEEDEGGQEVVEEPASEEPAVAKPKRGRPPKTKTAAKTQKAAEEPPPPDDPEPAPVAPPPKSNYARSKSKTITVDDPDPSAAPVSKAKSLPPKEKARKTPAVEAPRPPSSNRSRSALKAPSDSEVDDPRGHGAHVKSKPNGASKAESKMAPPTAGSDDEEMEDATSFPRDVVDHSMPPPPIPIGPPKGKNRKSSSTSDDAGYATAEYAMEIDIPDASRPHSRHQRNSSQPSSTKAISPPHDTRQTPAEPSKLSSREDSRPPSRSSSKPSSRSSARPGSVRPSSRLNEVVAISSDEEDALVANPTSKSVRKPAGKQTNRLVEDRARSRTPVVNGDRGTEPDALFEKSALAPARQPKPKAAPAKFQVEVVVPLPALHRSRTAPPPTEDVEMTDAVFSPHDSAPEPVATKLPPLVNGLSSRKASSVTPPPRTPSLPPTDSEPAEKRAHILPSFDDDMAGSAEAVPEVPFTPDFSLPPLTALTEEESSLTIEQFIRSEMDRQYQQLKEEGEKRIAALLEKAAETRRQIEAA